MNRIRFLTVCAVAAFIFAITMEMAIAAPNFTGTRIPSGDLVGDVVWTKEGSPYLLGGQVNVTSGHSLTIKPGVTIALDLKNNNSAQIVAEGGSVFIEGTKDERVTIKEITDIRVFGGFINVAYADIEIPGMSLFLLGSKAIIASSTISSLYGAGVYVWNSSANISDSVIRNNSTMGISIPEDFGGVHSSVVIKNSSIVGNIQNSIRNKGTYAVKAENNWWGSADGPAATGTNSIIGLVSYSPWLTYDPTATSTLVSTTTNCCSSILFIPGLEGSRLYTPENGLLKIFSSTNQLWEPNRNADVRKLYLNPDGTSVDPAIYSGAPIAKAFGIVDIYGKFINFLDGLTAKGTINEWKSFGYDWRKPITEVVAGAEEKATTTESLIKTVTELASRSRTGKVTLVAHSNGGLVAKYLVKTLADMGKEGLIDSVISVAVPYLGTPKAITALLHGDDQALGYGLISSADTMRGLGENMASAYSLLPSKEYFAKIFTPTIAFASTTVEGVNNGSYPLAIKDSVSQSNFIKDSNNVRVDPAFTSTNLPIKGNGLLIAAADIVHGILDPFSWPATISRWAIVGWNLYTTSGVTYSFEEKCPINFVGVTCPELLSHEQEKTKMGDGTVVSPSAAYNAGNTISVDLATSSINSGKNIDHVNILNASTTQFAIESIVSNNGLGGAGTVLNNLSKLPGVTIGEPDYSKEPTSLVLSTHSPVELHIYDSKGNHTGLVSKPPELADNDFISSMYETKIPGSSFEISEASDGNDTYIYLPNNTGDKYSVEILGTDIGLVTFDVEKKVGTDVLESVKYSMFTVTPLTVATTTVSDLLPQRLNIDVDGNNVTDMSIVPSYNKIPNQASTTESLRITLKALINNDPHAQGLLKRLDHVIEMMKNGKAKQASKQAEQFNKRLGHIKLKGISSSDRRKILDAIERIIIEAEGMYK